MNSSAETQHNTKSLRPFIGASNYNESRAFYRDLGFEEVVISGDMSLFKVSETMAFYLQDAYVKDWVDNTMLFLEVADVNLYFQHLQKLGLTQKYPAARLTPVREFAWGKECYLHDPSGILWHFGEFKK